LITVILPSHPVGPADAPPCEESQAPPEPVPADPKACAFFMKEYAATPRMVQRIPDPIAGVVTGSNSAN
jgi:hypothetical protein